jgi:hypothetical protein
MKIGDFKSDRWWKHRNGHFPMVLFQFAMPSTTPVLCLDRLFTLFRPVPMKTFPLLTLALLLAGCTSPAPSTAQVPPADEGTSDGVGSRLTN